MSCNTLHIYDPMEEPKSRLELLPAKALQAIQCFIDNVPDLASIILTCKAIYTAFVSADQLILKQVLTNEIGSEVLPEALLTALISRRVLVSGDVLDEHGNCLLENGRNIELKGQSNLRICDALFLSKLHSQVVYFTDDFISKALASRIFTKDISMTIKQRPASDKEKWRIQRTFYRFQFFCYVVHKKQTLFRFNSPSDQNRIFFNYFSVWENEQLACVYEYIFHIIAPGYDELVDHDVLWGEMMMSYASLDEPWCIDGLIAHGLFAVRKMAEAKSYDQISEAHGKYFLKRPRDASHLLDPGLKNSTVGIFTAGKDDWFWLEDYSTEEDDRLIKKPVWYDDEDKGPELAWRWAHQSFESRDFVLCEQHRFEREWGYVMWDYSRLLEFGVMENEWDRADVAEDGRDSRPSSESRDRRWKIYLAGGSGWWSAEDESKVVWPGGCAPWDKPVEIKPEKWDPKDGRTIDEAKEFIKRLRLQLP